MAKHLTRALLLALLVGLPAGANEYNSQIAHAKPFKCNFVAELIDHKYISMAKGLAMICDPNSEYCEIKPGECSPAAPNMTYQRYCSRTTGVPCIY